MNSSIFSQNIRIQSIMLNKRRRQERAKTASHRNECIERISFGEEAKQKLRNLSLINNIQYHERSQKQWSKEEDNLSFASFNNQNMKSLQNMERKIVKFKKVYLNSRDSSPVISNSCLVGDKNERKDDKYRKRLIPFSLDINTSMNDNDQRIHAISQRHNFIGGKQLHLFNQVIFRRTTTIINRAFKSAPTKKEHSLQKSQKGLNNYLGLSCKNGCSKIIPLNIHDLSVRIDDLKCEKKPSTSKKREQQFIRNKVNIIRKLLKEQRKSNFNQSMFQRQVIKPEF